MEEALKASLLNYNVVTFSEMLGEFESNYKIQVSEVLYMFSAAWVAVKFEIKDKFHEGGWLKFAET